MKYLVGKFRSPSARECLDAGGLGHCEFRVFVEVEYMAYADPLKL